MKYLNYVVAIMFMHLQVSMYANFLEGGHFKKVFTEPQLRKDFAILMDSVVRMISAADFYAYVDTHSTLNNLQTDGEIYAQLSKDRSKITPWFSAFYKLRSLRHQQAELFMQVEKLLKPSLSVVHGCVEIGSPGMYIQNIEKYLKVYGPIYSVNSQQSLQDYIKAWTFNPFKFFRAYDHFIPLDDYAPLAKEDIPDNSVDLVLCLIGLHHCVPEKLDAFIASIARVVRPGGVLILRDHDVINDDVSHIIDAGHSLYNILISDEPLDIQVYEYRNFQKLSYWIELLKKYGFQAGEERCVQEGDTSLNTMLKFTKIPETIAEKGELIARELHTNTDYVRANFQTYMTTIEWLDVDLSQDYGAYIDGTPFYEYPWFASLGVFWKIFFQSWKVAAHKSSHWDILTSSYGAMNLFGVITKTVEYVFKGLISFPLRLMFSGDETDKIQLLISDLHNTVKPWDDSVTVLKEYEDGHIQLISVPRYKKFLKFIMENKNVGFSILEIAGQKEIQLKVRYKNDADVSRYDGCVPLYEWHIPSQPLYTYCALNVQVDKLFNVINQLMVEGVEILYVHDF